MSKLQNAGCQLSKGASCSTHRECAQVEATLQHPAPKAPAAAAATSRSESSSIGEEVRKQLDLVGEQLAGKVCLLVPYTASQAVLNWVC